MKFSLAALTSALMATVLAVPTPGQDSDNIEYEVKDFYLRKPDGRSISTVSFTLVSTRTGKEVKHCRPYVPATDSFEIVDFDTNHVYSCSENSKFSFNYIPAKARGELPRVYLWQSNGRPGQDIGGYFEVNRYCRAGGNGEKDTICGLVDRTYVTLHQLGN